MKSSQQRQHTARFVIEAVMVIGLLMGLPPALVWLWSRTENPGWGEVRQLPELVTISQFPSWLIVVALFVVGWFLWLQLLVGVLQEVRGVRRLSLPGLSRLASSAGVVVGLVLTQLRYLVDVGWTDQIRQAIEMVNQIAFNYIEGIPGLSEPELPPALIKAQNELTAWSYVSR